MLNQSVHSGGLPVVYAIEIRDEETEVAVKEEMHLEVNDEAGVAENGYFQIFQDLDGLR